MDRTRAQTFTLPSDEEVFKMRDEETAQEGDRRRSPNLKGKTTRGKLPTGHERLVQLIGEEAAAKPKTRKAMKGEGQLMKQPDFGAALRARVHGLLWPRKRDVHAIA